MTILPQNYNYKSSLKSYSLSSHLQLLSYDQPPNTSPFLDAFKVGIPTFALAISYVCCTFWSLKNSYIHILFDQNRSYCPPFLLRYNSHSIHLTHLKCPAPWFLVLSELSNCHYNLFQNTFITPKRNFLLLTSCQQSLPISPTLPINPRQPLIYFVSVESPFLGILIYIEPYSMTGGLL